MTIKLMIIAAFMAGGAVVSALQRQVWIDIGTELGLHAELGTVLIGENRLSGRLRDFEVAVFPHDKAMGIDVFPVDPGFTLGRDSAMARMIKPDIETGSASFDDQIRIEGDSNSALALLGKEARRLTLIVVDKGGTVANRRIRCTVPTLKHVADMLDPMLDLAKELRRPKPEEIPALLARRALEEPFTGVRLQAFRKLASSYYRSDELLETARALADTWEASLQLEACRVLLRERVSLHGGDEGRVEGARAADELMKLVAAGHVDTSVRRSALESVARSPFWEDHVPAMAELVREAGEEPPEVRRAAISGLTRARALEPLLKVEPGDDVGEAETLARSLGSLGDAAAQPRLLDFLGHPDDRVRLAAAEALGAVGDAGAVEALRNATPVGVLAKLTLRRAVNTAIARIQDRLGGSQGGEISLTTLSPLEGAVSPTSDARGRSVGGAAAGDDDELGGEVSLA